MPRQSLVEFICECQVFGWTCLGMSRQSLVECILRMSKQSCFECVLRMLRQSFVECVFVNVKTIFGQVLFRVSR